jgi:acyl carrier protein
MTTFEQLRDILAQTLKIPPARITDTSKKADFPSWDSLGHVNLMMALEQTFGVFLEVEDFPKLVSVPDMLQYLKAQGIE